MDATKNFSKNEWEKKFFVKFNGEAGTCVVCFMCLSAQLSFPAKHAVH